MIIDQRTAQRLATTTRFTDLREFVEVDSTNRYLLEQARRGAPEGVVVVADHQSAGRGRRGRTWQAAPGAALLASILVRPDLAPDRRWAVPAAVVLAAANACASALARPEPGAGARPGPGPGRAVEIKWPNDLLLGAQKLAGILAEADGGAVVVGIGINVAGAPPGAACLGPSVVDPSVDPSDGPSVDRAWLLAELLTNLERWCDRWDEAADAYRSRCATVGRSVRVELAERSVVGKAVGVDPDGRLRVVVGKETLVLSVADVVHVHLTPLTPLTP